MAISWISLDVLEQHAKVLIERAQDASLQATQRRVGNVVDPFSTLIIAATFNIANADILRKMQVMQSAISGLSNALGVFHQSVLGSLDGWENHDAGYDLECDARNIIAEVKNKHNTMNAPNRLKVVEDLKTAIRQKRGNWTAYLVQIIPKRPKRYVKNIAPNVFDIDGASFYGLATGNPNAIHELFDWLCRKTNPSNEIVSMCAQIMQKSLPSKE